MLTDDIAVVTSSALAKNGGIQTITKSYFSSLFPIFDLASAKYEQNQLNDFHTVLFSGFDQTFVALARHLKSIGKNLAVLWHFSCACEVDSDVGNAWRALIPLISDRTIDLFITCKKGFDLIIANMFPVTSCFVMNNILESSFRDISKSGLGIYSGSSNYWVKNLYSNLYACLMTGLPIDIIPYDDTLKSVVQSAQKEHLVTGLSEKILYEDFLKRLSSRELISYISFTESSPLVPLEALNNGVICLTGNTHHYFESDYRLHSFLVVSRPDDPISISHAIDNALKNKTEILERYLSWKAGYDKIQRNNFEHFISILTSL